LVVETLGGKVAKIDDGGPEHPCTLDAWTTGFAGASRRQVLARSAMRGMLENSGFTFEEIAKYAYDMADAMLAYEREEQVVVEK